jgi:uncharacterized protein (TIGR03437 family)
MVTGTGDPAIDAPAIQAAVDRARQVILTGHLPFDVPPVLSLFATGLGPTRPGVDPGPFPAKPPAIVNSRVDVKANGKSADVLGAVGYPGSLDGYQVNFRVPADTAARTATIQLGAAWIAGSAVTIPVQ